MTKHSQQNTLSRNNLLPFTLLLSAFIALSLTTLFTLLRQPQDYNLIYLTLVFFGGVYYADFVSGIVHSVLDYTQLKENSGLVDLFYYKGSRGTEKYLALRSKAIKKAGNFHRHVYDFKHHHLINARTVATTPAYNNFMLTLPINISLCLLSLILAISEITNHYIVIFFLVAGVISLFAQYIHACAHGRKNFIINNLQNMGVLMSREKHLKHHNGFQENFCFVNGWADSLVNRIVKLLIALNIYKISNLNPPPEQQDSSKEA